MMNLPKIIDDYPDYLIYDDGRVWSNKTNKEGSVDLSACQS